MNILIVEDEILTMNALQHSVKTLGHHPFLAKTGEEAITHVANNKIDFIISDIMMPGISGLSLVSVLRNIHLCHAPIILMSTLDNHYIRKSSDHLGADGFISKPFTTEDIATVIRTHYKLS